ncbi:hypothetical protein E2G70_11045 [Salmonella enterica subsp. enterica serovar Agona]|nr:hypothetical protein [Salmonella enterica subsp. enterica serovar Agona]EEN3595040.1 hypothetical protein [Salmonella enterica subsp. enterica serovar Enteritidis]EGP3924135.1 hypothetical protein [Salmonella enterica subsp. enterica serovar Typhimurium]
MLKRILVVVAFVMTLASCAIQPNAEGQFSTVPVDQHDMVIYTCTGASQEFVDFKPVPSSLKLMPLSVLVMDTGANWVASWNEGKIESPQLYKDLLGKVDGNLNVVTGERYYRVNGLLSKTPTFAYSSINYKTGEGKGVTFFRCHEGSIPDTGTMLHPVE